MKQNEIYEMYGTDYKDMTLRLLQEADLESLIGSKDKKIGIKPNLVSPSPACYGATTHPEIVEGIIEYLQRKGFSHLFILEGSWVGDKTQEAAQVCGFLELSKKYQVPFWDTQKDSAVVRTLGETDFFICKSVEQIDFLINVPVMKGHCQTKITCALKNMKGLIPNKEKRRFHAMGLHKPIASLNKIIRQDFIVVDNICGDLDFEDGGNPVTMNRIFVCQDPVLCDSYVCREMHYKKEEIDYLTEAEKMGVGNGDLSQAVIRNLSSASSKTTIPCSRKVVEVSDVVEEVESCSACYAYLIPALDQLRREGLLENFTEKISIGQAFRNKTGKLGIGQCTCKFQHTLKGCPPLEHEIYQFLKDYIQSRKEA